MNNENQFRNREEDDRKTSPWLHQSTPGSSTLAQADDRRFQDGEQGYSTDHWVFFCGIFLFASLGGLAALLRSGQSITWVQIVSAILNSGIMGFIVALVLWSRFAGQDIYLLIGISAMAGFGGTTVVDFSIKVLKKKASVLLGVDVEEEQEKETTPPKHR